MNKKALPYGLEPHEIGFLILVAVAFYVSTLTSVPKFWGLLTYSAALLAAVPVLIFRCRDEWRRMPHRGFFLGLAAVWVAMFACLGNAKFTSGDTSSLMIWLYSIYTAPSMDEGHGLLIPFVVLGLYWWKRKEMAGGHLQAWWPALGILFVAIMCHIVGFVAQQQRLSVIGFLLGLYGLTGLAWGRHWLTTSFFPFFLLIFCVPVADYDAMLTMPLRLLVTWIVEIIARIGLAPDLIREGTQLFDSSHTFAYEVAPACSGIHSLTALVALMTIYAFLNFKAPWKRWVMILIAVPLSVVGNVARLCVTVAVAEMGGQAAGKAVETNFGFLTFAVAVGCAFLVARWLERVKDKPSTVSGNRETLPEEDASAPLMQPSKGAPIALFIVTFLLIGVTAGVLVQTTYHQKLGLPGVKTRPLAGSSNLEVLLPAEVAGYKSEAFKQPEGVVNALPPDTSFGQIRYLADDGFWSMVNVVLMGTARSSIHKPQICLTAQGWNINESSSHQDVIHMDRPMPYDLPVMRLNATKELQQDGRIVQAAGVYVYWFVDSDRFTASRATWNLWMAKDIISKGELDRWAYIAFFSVCAPGQEDATYEQMKKLITSSVPGFQLVPKAATAAK